MSKYVRKVEDVVGYVTKDGSLVYEVLHPKSSAISKGSVAVAVVKPKSRTKLHYHELSEEVYFVWKGRGIVRVGEERTRVEQGCFVLIPPRTKHCIENDGSEELVIVCYSTPPYSHRDTVLVE